MGVIEAAEDSRRVSRDAEGAQGDFFYPVSVWLEKEGGGEEAVRGLKHFVERLIAQDMVEEMVDINEWTGRVELALPRKTKVEAQGDKWDIRETCDAKASTTASASSAEGQASVAASTVEGATEASGQTLGKKRKQVQTPSTQEDDKNEEPAPGKTKPKKQKPSPQETTEWKRLGAIKSLLDKGVSSASSVMRKIETDETCAWGKALPEHITMVATMSQLEQQTFLHVFWQDVQLASLVELKKKYEGADMLSEMAARAKDFEPLAQSLVNGSTTIKRMFAARRCDS